MINYELKNQNPKNKKTTDCVIRALTEATGKSYYDIYDDLYKLSIKTGYFINEKRLYEKLIESYGFVKVKQPIKWNDKKYLIGELDELIRRADIIIVSCAHHLACVKNHTLYDLWDCRRKSVGNYFIKK